MTTFYEFVVVQRAMLNSFAFRLVLHMSRARDCLRLIGLPLLGGLQHVKCFEKPETLIRFLG